MIKKYKNKILRVAVVVISLLIVFSVTAVTAFADDAWKTVKVTEFSDILDFRSGFGDIYYSIEGKNYGGMYFARQYDLSTTIVQGFPAYMSRNSLPDPIDVQVGDDMIISPFQFNYMTGQGLQLYSCRWIVGYFDFGEFEIYGTSSYFSMSGQSPDITNWYHYTTQETTVHMNKAGSVNAIALEFQFAIIGQTETTFTLGFGYTYSFSVSYGNPGSPQAPKYETFDGSSVNELEQTEEEVLNGAQGGLDAFKQSVTVVNTSIQNFYFGLLACVDMINVFLGITALSDIINISLGFGLFAFILSGSLVAYAARASRSDRASRSGGRGKGG